MIANRVLAFVTTLMYKLSSFLHSMKSCYMSLDTKLLSLISSFLFCIAAGVLEPSLAVCSHD